MDFKKNYPQGTSGVASDHKGGLRNASLSNDENSRLFVKKTIVVGNVSKLVSNFHVFSVISFWIASDIPEPAKIILRQKSELLYIISPVLLKISPIYPNLAFNVQSSP